MAVLGVENQLWLTLYMNGVQGAVSDLLLGSVGHSKSTLYLCTKLSK